MIEFELNKNNNMFSIIKTYFAQYILNGSKFNIITIRDRMKRDYDADLYTNHITIPYGISNISYELDDKNITFKINYIKSGLPVGLDCETQQHEEMYLIIDDAIYPNYRNIIDKLIMNARNYYDKNIKKRTKSRDW